MVGKYLFWPSPRSWPRPKPKPWFKIMVLILITWAQEWIMAMGKSFPPRHGQDQDIYRPWSRHIQIRRTPSKYFPRTSAASPASRLDNVFFPHINFAYNSHQGHTRLLTHVAELNELLLLLPMQCRNRWKNILAIQHAFTGSLPRSMKCRQKVELATFAIWKTPY